MSIIRRLFTILLPQGNITDIAAANSGYQTGSSYNFTLHCDGANRVALISVSMLSVLGSSVTNITVGGVGATFVRAKSSTSGAVRVEIWRLVAPTIGDQTVAVTLSAALDSIASAICLSGVDQTTPVEASNDASATNGAGAADATVNVTTVSANAWTWDTVATTDTSISVGAGQLQRSNVTGTLGSGASSTEGPTVTAGSVTMSWTNVAGLATWTIVAVCVAPVSTTGLVNWPGFMNRGFLTPAFY